MLKSIDEWAQPLIDEIQRTLKSCHDCFKLPSPPPPPPSPADHQSDTGQNFPYVGLGGDPDAGYKSHLESQMAANGMRQPTDGDYSDVMANQAQRQTLDTVTVDSMDLNFPSAPSDRTGENDPTLDISCDAQNDLRPPQCWPLELPYEEQWEQTYGCGGGHTDRFDTARENDSVDQFIQSCKQAGISAAPTLEQDYNCAVANENNGSTEIPQLGLGDMRNIQPLLSTGTANIYTSAWVAYKGVCQQVLLEVANTLNHFNDKNDFDKYVIKVWSSGANPLFKITLRAISSLATYAGGCVPQPFGQSAPSQVALARSYRASPERTFTPVVSSLQHRRSKWSPDPLLRPWEGQLGFLGHFGTTGHREVDTIVKMTRAKKRAVQRKAKRMDKRVWQYFIRDPSKTLQPKNNAKDMREVYTRLIARSNTKAKPWNGVLSDLGAVSHNPFSEWIDVMGIRGKIYVLFEDVPGLSIEVCQVKGQQNVKLFVMTPPSYADDKEHACRTIDFTSRAMDMNEMLAEWKIDDVDVEIWEANFQLVVV
ncbi:unnamed protein product [Fusarium langsethiae]|nr:unnamed protein product [Fusarium langsethiae]